jgi:broad specificity phosphatase PhoE
MDATRIIAIRHGETAWNVDSRLQGHLDIPLNDVGLWQARQAALALADEPIDAIYSSDLQRAWVTAQAIAETTQAPLAAHQGLRERSFGVLQGHTFEELEAKEPEQAYRWRKRDPAFAPEGGESLIALRERITATTYALAAHMWAGRSCWWPTAACWTCCTAPPPARTFKPRAPGSWAMRPSTACSGHPTASAWWAGPTHSTWTTPYAMKTTPDALTALIGQRVDLIDTPALVVDLDAMDRNIQRMADFARKHQVRWRPTPRCTKAPSWPCCCSKPGHRACACKRVSEAEALAAGGVLDITITNEVIAMPKLHRAARLATALPAGAAAWAWRWTARRASSAWPKRWRSLAATQGMDVLVEIDVGQGRCGVPPGEAAVALALAVARHPGCALPACRPTTAAPSTCQRGRAARGHCQARRAGGLSHARPHRGRRAAVPLVTGSGTGTLVHEAASGVYGELQAGSFLFMDADYARNERDPPSPRSSTRCTSRPR